MNGLDYSMGIPDIAAMKRGNVSFVCRYVGWSDLAQTKILTLTEAKLLSQNGIALVSNYEWYGSRPQEGAAAASVDAARALQIHASCGGPDTAPIYFSVDYDSPGSDVAAYFKELVNKIGLHRVGAYGGYRCIKYLFDNGLIAWGWQTYAWSGGQWDNRAHIRQTQNAVQFASIEVDFDTGMFDNIGQWKTGGIPMATKKWYEYPWGVHFGTGDKGFNGAHDATILAPANYEVTFPLSGSIVDLSAPSWGKQVGIHLDSPYNGIPFFTFLHLSALSPSLTPGKHVNKGDIAGWVGGATNASQYNGTSNPTGSNFLNDPVMSSQIQVGFALSRGPVYGSGAGWSTNPDSALNPEQIITDLRSNGAMVNQNQRTAFEKEWRGVLPDVSVTSGIANTAWSDYQAGKYRGPALSHEYQTFTWAGTTVIVQLTAGGRYEWDGRPHFYPYS